MRLQITTKFKTKELEVCLTAIRTISMMARDYPSKESEGQFTLFTQDLPKTFEHSRKFPKIALKPLQFPKKSDDCRRLPECFRKFQLQTLSEIFIRHLEDQRLCPVALRRVNNQSMHSPKM